MPVPTDISTLSTTASTNYPAGIEFAYEGDNHLRQIYAFFAHLRDGFHGRRNRIINGDMRIDQRVAGSVTADGSFPVDRWRLTVSGSGTMTIAKSTSTPPAGFTTFLRVTATASDTAGAAEYYALQHRIEGNNVADLDWGLATAKTVAVSFWVRSSLTGTFSGAISNSATDRSYPFTYAISAANTWEYKTVVTTAGDTTGTWATDTTAGIIIGFNMGSGSNFLGTAATWAASNYLGTPGSVAMMATGSSTWDVTGVQFEAGSQPTGFQYVQHGEELALCQRYYQTGLVGQIGYGLNGATFGVQAMFPVPLRTTPTSLTATYSYVNAASGTIDSGTSVGFRTYATASSTAATSLYTTYTAVCEL